MQPQLPSRQRAYRISPLKCRDLAATLEFEIVWEVLQAPSPYNSAAMPTPTSVASPQTSGSFAGRPPSSVTSSMLNKHRYGAAYGGGYGGGGGDTASVTSSRRTLSSQGSEQDLLADLSSPSCGECRATKRRMERKEVQILQLESFLKESQKRIDSLVFENEELVVRETAETKNANLHRALNMRMLQELEMAFQFCATQMRTVNLEAAKTGQGDEAAKAAAFMFLPQFEFMERVKQFHQDLGLDPSTDLDDDLHDHEADLDEDQQYLQSKAKAKLPAAKKTPMEALQTFDFRMEMDTALERNQRLQRQLEFINRAMSYEQPQDLKSVADSDFDAEALTLGVGASMPRLHRAATNTSATTSGRSSNSGDDPLASSLVAPVLTMTEQINLLERENFLLKAKLESTASKLRDFESVNHPHSETSETTSTSSQNSHMNPALSTPASSRGAPQDDEIKRSLQQIRDEKIALARQLDSAQAEIDSLTERLEQASLSASAIAKSTAEGNTAAPGFLNKIYMDVGKAKIVLEEKVKQLNQQLTTATEEKTELQTRVNELELQLANASSGHTAGDGDLQAKLVDIEQEMMNQSSQIDSHKQELMQAKQRLNDKQQDYNVLEKSKLRVEKELESVLKTLLKAQDECTNLETQVESLQQQLQTVNSANSMSTSATAATPTPLGGTGNSMSMSSVSSLNSSFIVAGGENRDDEVMELSKQLKLSKQEVMQLRYRSNQLESVHEKLEDALKEKRTLQVKLTALEGQLYEHRSRSINDNSFASSGLHDKSFGGASVNNTQGNTDTAMIVELQRQLDQKSAQLLICQRELEMMRRELMSAGSSQPTSPSVSAGTLDNTDLDSLSTKVTAFEGEIARLRERNEDQATRLEALDNRIAEVVKERTELENIVHEMIAEMDQMTDGQVSAGAEAFENDEYENKAHASSSQSSMEALMPVTIADRYAAANNSNNSRKVDATPSPAAPPSPTRDGRSGSGSKIAHLIKNFSNDENSTSSVNRGDFRNRNASTSSNNASAKGSFVGAMASRFQQRV